MLSPMYCNVAMLAFFTGLAACGSNGPSGPPPSPCTTSMVPATVHLTVSGFSKCSCFNGSFALTKESQIESPDGTEWSSMPIMPEDLYMSWSVTK